MQSVLFICINNSARSQMAEAFVNMLGAGEFKAESAGLEPTEILPLVVSAMAEVGVDLSGKKTQSVFDLFKEGRRYDYVITVCDVDASVKCPVFPGIVRRISLPFPDPATVEGVDETRLDGVRKIRDAIKERMIRFMDCARTGRLQRVGPDWALACEEKAS